MTYTCTCGDTYEEVIAKTADHTYEAVVTAPTCTAKGYTTYTCACGESFISDYTNPVGHEYKVEITVTATHTKDGEKTYTCVCGDSYKEIIPKGEGHDYKANVKEPTCLIGGYVTYSCECGDCYIGEYLEMLPHDDSDGDGRCNNCQVLIEQPDRPSGKYYDIFGPLIDFFEAIRRFFNTLFDIFG